MLLHNAVFCIMRLMPSVPIQLELTDLLLNSNKCQLRWGLHPEIRHKSQAIQATYITPLCLELVCTNLLHHSQAWRVFLLVIGDFYKN